MNKQEPEKQQDYSEFIVEHIKSNMMIISSMLTPKRVKTHDLLRKLNVQINMLIKQGFTFGEVSDVLKLCDVSIPAEQIKEFLVLDQLHRTSNIESKLLQKSRRELRNNSILLHEYENDLKRSIDSNEGLYLTYQPQINVNTGTIIGAEALVRWKHKGSVIHPSEFIAIAEQSDLILDLGNWIIREACGEAKRWEELSLGGDKPIKISVNMSVKQLYEEIPETVDSMMRNHGLLPGSIGIEITESFMLQKNYASVLKKFKDNGISLSIDDFGTGYSCLSELKFLPFDVIKIDRSFVQIIETEYRSSMIVESIVDLAKKFEMSTLAEGVETPKQVEILRKLGCNVCQGYHFSEPLTGNGFIRFVDHGISDLHI